MDGFGRIEYKYLIPNSRLDWLRAYMAPYVRNDRHATDFNHGAYRVRSIYYDTRDLDFYHEKKAGIKVRKKVRIRGYNEYEGNDRVFLEIKRKNDTTITKNRAHVPYDKLLEWMKPGNAWPDEFGESGSRNYGDFKQFIFQMHRYHLGAVVNVIYDREAYYSSIEPGLRITLDRDLHGNVSRNIGDLFEDSHQAYPFPDHFVMEVKTHKRFPHWLEYVISRLGVRFQSVSKYCRCIDALKENGYTVQPSYCWAKEQQDIEQTESEYQPYKLKAV